MATKMYGTAAEKQRAYRGRKQEKTMLEIAREAEAEWRAATERGEMGRFHEQHDFWQKWGPAIRAGRVG